MQSQNQYKLNNPPTDCISCVKFSNVNSNELLVTSWDTTARVYDVVSNTIIHQWQHSQPCAILDGSFSNDGMYIFTGGLDSKLVEYNVQTGTTTEIGSHQKAIKCIVTVPNHPHLILTGSWDEYVRLWDRRSKTCVASICLNKKVYSMDITPDASKFIVGTNERQVFIYDMNHSIKLLKDHQHHEFKLLQHRVSSLKYQTRCIKCSPDLQNQGYVLASIEGRVSVEYIDPSEAAQAKKYAFKCHRKTVNGVETLYPVNAVAFHPSGTFATGGCDQIVNIWDAQRKKRLCQYPKYPTSISGLAFNNTGTLLAIASSYTFEQGEIDHTPDEVYIYRPQEGDVTPKPPPQ